MKPQRMSPVFGVSAREIREADLFYADLMGVPLRPRSRVLRPPGRFAMEEADPPVPTCPLPKGSSCAYFFRGAGYIRYNMATDRVDVGPAPIAQFWPRLPAELQRDLDASVNWGDGRVFFFKGARCLDYNLATDRPNGAVVPIAQLWPKLPATFQSNLDAVVNWGDGTAFFFKGDSYLRYNIATDAVDVAPRTIASGWTLPATFQSGLDSVVNWGNGFVYFFKGAEYVRFNVAAKRTDDGPKTIAQGWPMLPAEFQSRVKAALNWTDPCNLASLLRTAGVTVQESRGWETRGRGCFTPVGIMMHHTVGVGAAALGDIETNNKANFFVDRAGVITVVTRGRANHAGKGAQQVLDETAAGVAPSGTAASRRLADGPLGNGHYYGFENENKGDGVQTWPEVQLDAMARAAAALCQRHCWSANRIVAHKEWTSRKIDPKGFDMNDFRARVTALF